MNGKERREAIEKGHREAVEFGNAVVAQLKKNEEAVSSLAESLGRLFDLQKKLVALEGKY